MARSAPYIFGSAASDPELRRLRLLETALDDASKRVLLDVSPVPGWSCLEVGAGAGSIARWLGETVGPAGHVTALDVDPRFLGDGLPRNVRVVRHDVREWEADGEFDLVHARYVLVHMPEVERALRRMAASVRPGGFLVVEEPDFVAARFAGGPTEFARAFERVNAAIEAMFTARALDPALGLRLPAAVGEAGLTVVAVESEGHLAAGGSTIALMMKASTEELRDKYVETGLADDDDIEGYRRFAEDPRSWGVYYATVRVVARR
jgi:SAM-dependent methyltransferase